MFVNFLVWLAFWLLVAIVRPPEAVSIAVLERASNGNGVPSRQPSKDAAGRGVSRMEKQTQLDGNALACHSLPFACMHRELMRYHENAGCTHAAINT